MFIFCKVHKIVIQRVYSYVNIDLLCVKQALIIIKTRCEPLFKFTRVRLRYRRILNLHLSYLTSKIRNVRRKHCKQSKCILQENSRLLCPSQQMFKCNRSTGGEAFHHLKMRPKVRLLGSTYRYRL